MKTRKEQIEEMANIIKAEYEEWLDTTGVIPKGTTYYAECIGCAIDSAETIYNAGYGDISEYKAEIERLKAENEKLLDSIESVQAGRCRLRCPLTEQAVKEFAERLKKYSYTDNCFKDGKWHRYVLVSDIDELIGGKEK